ncbi:MAG TPA: YgiQ family radical SAM protein [Planctomycetaceae bacterium]|nr:YgiQ family radical SAM protein [Planctomycetaceae bacterium]
MIFRESAGKLAVFSAVGRIQWDVCIRRRSPRLSESRQLPNDPPPLPMTPAEVAARGWDAVDVVFVTGDAYVDHPSFAAALLGRCLESAGFRVAILSQPDWHSCDDWRRFGRPRVCFAVSAGNMDSMVNHYTANRKKRNDDAYSPGGLTGLRPDRATLAYCQRAREAYGDVPIVAGGIEASLRRIAHYDYWSDKVRRSILCDAKPDLLVHGMGESTLLTIVRRLAEGAPVESLHDLRGVAYRLGASQSPPAGDVIELPRFEDVAKDKRAFVEMTRLAHRETNPHCARPLVQAHGRETVVVNPPAMPLSTDEMDAVYGLPFTRRPHPSYGDARIPAFDVVKDSIQIVRGCFGGCTFCSLSAHQGRIIQSRSEASVLAEIDRIAGVRKPKFGGTISDLGGPTANMYGYECEKKLKSGSCKDKRCLYPQVCNQLLVDHGPLLKLMQRLERIPGIKKVQVSSGVRYDLLQADPKGDEYLAEVVKKHVSGQMKVAPEHTEDHVLKLMGKPGTQSLLRFKTDFERHTRDVGKEHYLTYYLIAAHPGCTMKDMQNMHRFTKEQLKLTPEQVQVFTPSPSTYSTLMYYTEKDPFTGEKLFVEKGLKGKEAQKVVVTGKTEYRKFHKNNQNRSK